MPINKVSLLTLAGGLVFALACGSPDAAQEGGLPADHPPLDGTVATMPVDPAAQFAVVKETMDAGGYTYALLNLAGDEAWAAGPVTALTVGDEVAVTGAYAMENFHSSSLDRTFDVIYFVGAYTLAGDVQMQAAAPPMSADPAFAGTVLEAIGAAGYVYLRVGVDDGEIWLAAPSMQVAVGDEIAWDGGMPMQNFSSTSLNRTFEAILFVEAIAVN